jgi:hypothetical protein
MLPSRAAATIRQLHLPATPPKLDAIKSIEHQRFYPVAVRLASAHQVAAVPMQPARCEYSSAEYLV